MRIKRVIPVLVCAVGLGLAGCSEDAPVADAEPGGMGAGRPDTTGASVPGGAQEVLGATGHPEHQDTTGAGGTGMTATLRDSLNDGEATGISQPQPDRPAN